MTKRQAQAEPTLAQQQVAPAPRRPQPERSAPLAQRFADPSTAPQLRPTEVLAVQRTLGNRATGRLLGGAARPPAPVRSTAGAVIQRLQSKQHNELQLLLKEDLKELWGYLLLISEDDYEDADKLSKYFKGDGITDRLAVVLQKQRKTLTKLDQLYDSSPNPNGIDELIMLSVYARFDRLLKFLEDGNGARLLDTVRERNKIENLTEEHPIKRIIEQWYAGISQLRDLPDDSKQQKKIPKYANKQAHKGTLHMDVPPGFKPLGPPKGDVAMISFQNSHNLLKTIRDTYGLRSIKVEGVIDINRRRWTNNLLWGLIHVIDTQTHSYLGSDINFRIDIAEGTDDSPLMAQVKYSISKEADVTISIEGTGEIKLPKTFKGIKEAQESMQKIYSLKGFREDGGKWSLEDLIKLNEVLVKITGDDESILKMLEGLLIVRSGKGQSGTEDAIYDGLSHTLRVYNQLYDADQISFSGSAKDGITPHSYRPLAHEIGHLILASKHRRKLSSLDTEIFQSKEEQKVMLSSGKEIDKRIFVLNKTIEEDDLFGDDDTLKRWQKMNNEQIKKEKEQLREEIKQLEQEKIKLKHEQKQLDLKMLVVEKPNIEKDEQSKYLLVKNEKPTVSKFMKDMNQAQVGPITDYAARSQGSVNEELLVEAYGLYITDPTFVKSISIDLYKWFDKKEYLK